MCKGTRQKQRVLVRLQMFGNSHNPGITVRKARNKAGVLLIHGFHCHGKQFGFHPTDEDSQRMSFLLGSTGKKVPLFREWRRLVMRHHRHSGENKDRGV